MRSFFTSLVTLCCMFLLVTSSASADDAKVEGSFKGNGKDGNLKYVSVFKQKEDGKETYQIIFTEKDHSKEKKPDFKAMFGDLGDALILTCNPQGKIVGCMVVHSAHKKQGFNSIGEIETKDFKLADGKLTSTVTTNGEIKSFGETWQVDLKFSCKVR